MVPCLFDWWPKWRTFKAGTCAFWDPSLDIILIDLDKVDEIARRYDAPRKYVLHLLYLLEIPHRSFITTSLCEFICSIERELCRKLCVSNYTKADLKQLKEELIISEIVHYNLMDSARPFQEAIALFIAEETIPEFSRRHFPRNANKYMQIYEEFKRGTFNECLTRDCKVERTSIEDFYKDIKWLSKNRGLKSDHLLIINCLTHFIPGKPDILDLFPYIPVTMNPKYLARDVLDLLKKASSKITPDLLRRISIAITWDLKAFSKVFMSLKKTRYSVASDIGNLFDSTFVAIRSSRSFRIFAKLQKSIPESLPLLSLTSIKKTFYFNLITLKEMVLVNRDIGNIKCLLCNEQECHEDCSMYPILRRFRRISEKLREIEVSETLKRIIKESGPSYLKEF